MLRRLVKPHLNHSFFLFGPRGVGKSTFIKSEFLKEALFLNLLIPEVEEEYSLNPSLLIQKVESSVQRYEWVAIDEVQKVPKLLDVVHYLIEERGQKFILTGSSARKLKRGAANLLAGRAFVNHLFPLTCLELGSGFDLKEILHWGALPRLASLQSEEEKLEYLKSYALTYVNEEIRSEQLVRDLVTFRKFLPISAQMSGKVMNYSKISREVGVDEKTIQNYYSILEDTWMGFHLESFHLSIRKSQKRKPKFYWFDPGVKRVLDQTIYSRPQERTGAYGELFEHFVILEVFKLNHYWRKDFTLSYLETTNGGEIDLILSRGKDSYAIEIKSTHRVDRVEVNKLKEISGGAAVFKKAYYLSQDPTPQIHDSVHCLHWKDFFKEMEGF